MIKIVSKDVFSGLDFVPSVPDKYDEVCLHSHYRLTRRLVIFGSLVQASTTLRKSLKWQKLNSIQSSISLFNNQVTLMIDYLRTHLHRAMSQVALCPLDSCKLQRPPMVRFYCDSPDSPGSTAHQVNPPCSSEHNWLTVLETLAPN